MLNVLTDSSILMQVNFFVKFLSIFLITVTDMEVDGEVDGKLAQQFGCMGTSDKESLIMQFRQILNGSQDAEINYDACAFFLDMNNWLVDEKVK